MDKYKFQEITIKEFEEKYPHYSLDGDKSPYLKYLKGIFVDISGKVNMSNDPFVIIVFAKDNNKVIGQRLNGGEDVVPDGLFNTLAITISILSSIIIGAGLLVIINRKRNY